MESGGASLVEGARLFLDDLAKGRISMTDEQAFEVGRNVATTPGRGGVRERAVPADRVQAADGEGARAAAADRAAVHQQVLHPRPAARELADPLRGRRRATACSWCRWRNAGRVAWRSSTWDDYIEDGVHPGDRRGAATISRRRPDQHARLLRRRHDARHRAGGAGGARRAAGGERDAADHVARLLRHRRARPVHRRGDRSQLREMHASAERRPAARAASWPRPSASCAPTTWSGTTSSATT